ncbi:MAG TPA: RNA-binding protein [Chthoniobacterales bacterium]
MATQSSGRSRRSRGGRARRGGGDRPYRPKSSSSAPKAPAKQTLWQKITAFFSGNGNPPLARVEQPRSSNGSHAKAEAPAQQQRTSRQPEQVEVTSPRLYVGNLSFEATESDLFELFNGVGQVQNAEVVTYKHNQRSKGFAFVQMLTVEEAQRAVTELHDKEFLGRKLLVSGAKSTDRASDSDS